MKMYRFEVYVVDPNGDFTIDDIVLELEMGVGDLNVVTHVRSIESTDIGEWTDDHPVNKMNISDEALKKYFEE